MFEFPDSEQLPKQAYPKRGFPQRALARAGVNPPPDEEEVDVGAV